MNLDNCIRIFVLALIFTLVAAIVLAAISGDAAAAEPADTAPELVAPTPSDWKAQTEKTDDGRIWTKSVQPPWSKDFAITASCYQSKGGMRTLVREYVKGITGQDRQPPDTLTDAPQRFTVGIPGLPPNGTRSGYILFVPSGPDGTVLVIFGYWPTAKQQQMLGSLEKLVAPDYPGRFYCR